MLNVRKFLFPFRYTVRIRIRRHRGEQIRIYIYWCLQSDLVVFHRPKSFTQNERILILCNEKHLRFPFTADKWRVQYVLRTQHSRV